jgi:hypothetical protein
MRTDKSWTLAEGIEEARRLEVQLRVRSLALGVALTGSVLHKGSSPKDLDLIVYPHNASDPYPWNEVARCLREDMGYRLMMCFSNILEIRRKKGIRCDDTKHVDAWYSKDLRRVDVFQLGAK